MYKYTFKKELRIRKKLRNYIIKEDNQDNKLVGREWLISDYLKSTIRKSIDKGCDGISFSKKIENDENGNNVAYYDKFFDGIYDGDIRITKNDLDNFASQNGLNTKIENDHNTGEPMKFIIYY